MIFTDPTVASVGLTEKSAQEQGIRTITRTITLGSDPRALANFAALGLIKMVAESEPGRIIGVHVFSYHAEKIIQCSLLDIRSHMSVQELGDKPNSPTSRWLRE
ncbi:MAG: hypothetical protein ACYCYP_07585 [Leptospirales bacterium]